MDQDEESQSASIEIGAQVVDNAGQPVGTVIDVDPSFVVVEQGTTTNLYIPIDSIGSFDAATVTLTVSRDEAVSESLETDPPAMVGFASTENYPPGILIGGQVEELGTTEEELDVTVDEIGPGTVTAEPDLPDEVTEEALADGEVPAG